MVRDNEDIPSPAQTLCQAKLPTVGGITRIWVKNSRLQKGYWIYIIQILFKLQDFLFKRSSKIPCGLQNGQGSP